MESTELGPIICCNLISVKENLTFRQQKQQPKHTQIVFLHLVLKTVVEGLPFIKNLLSIKCSQLDIICVIL